MMTTCPTDSHALLQRLALADDRAAWSALVERYAKLIHRTACGVLGPVPEADDVVQETLLHLRSGAAYVKRIGGDDERHIERWIRRLAINVALNLRRGDMRRQQRERSSGKERAAAVASETGIAVNDNEAKHMLREALAEMSEARRQPLVLHYYLGLDHNELSQQMGCTPGAARVRLHRSLQALRKKLERITTPVLAASLCEQLSAMDLSATTSSAPSAAQVAEWQLLSVKNIPAILRPHHVFGGLSLMSKAAIACASIILVSSIAVTAIKSHGAEATPTSPAPTPDVICSGVSSLAFDGSFYVSATKPAFDITKATLSVCRSESADHSVYRIDNLLETEVIKGSGLIPYDYPILSPDGRTVIFTRIQHVYPGTPKGVAESRELYAVEIPPANQRAAAAAAAKIQPRLLVRSEGKNAHALCAFSPDGRKLLIQTTDEKGAQFRLGSSDGSDLRTVAHPDYMLMMAVPMPGDDGRVLASIHQGGKNRLAFLDGSTGAIVKELQNVGGNDINNLVVSTDGRYVAYTASAVHDTSTSAKIADLTASSWKPIEIARSTEEKVQFGIIGIKGEKCFASRYTYPSNHGAPIADLVAISIPKNGGKPVITSVCYLQTED
jgi:RNA polymerase sigma factor (sigma-70 family)